MSRILKKIEDILGKKKETEDNQQDSIKRAVKETEDTGAPVADADAETDASEQGREDENEIEGEEEQVAFVDDTVMDICEEDKNKVWAFCAGQYSNDFRGNPKWLFIYINHYRKDITPYWLCDDVDIILYIRSLGWRAYKLGTRQAEEAIEKTGVLVSEQVKMGIPKGLMNAKYLNLWHGVGGVKAVERALTEGTLRFEIAKKYIQKNEYYRNHELYLAPSPFIEEIAKTQLGVSPDHIIKAGYPRCIYQKNFKTFSSFNHDIVGERNLPENTRIVAYTPTYRNNPSGELFPQAFPDMERLIQICEEQHLLMIFKMHPLLEKELAFIQAKETYANCPWLMFWDNREDFYEIMDKVDLCIMDYSSIFTDFVASGVKHYIRYIVDFNPDELEFPLGYDEATLGPKCYSYEELLEALKHYQEIDLSEDIARIRELHWPYSGADSMDTIIDATLNATIGDYACRDLYSFDIFDTLISRKVLDPKGIFYYVKEKMQESHLDFPSYLVEKYPMIRINAERNVREYYNRSKAERDDERCEIQFTYIFKRLNDLYHLTAEQTDALMNWELEAELENVIPVQERVDSVKELVASGETVVLISDMYLSKEFIRKMLAKADPVLAELPIYLSSEYGYQKSAQGTLYLEVYKEYGEAYNFRKWVHCGDNRHSDYNMARKLNIEAHQVSVPKKDGYVTGIIDSIGTYDSFLVAANMARFSDVHKIRKAQFVYNYISLLFVPYVYWAVHDAIANGDEIIYFISRDGYHLKRIADTIIEAENLQVETKYIYASRRTWRIPSFIDHIDVGFWGQGYGNFAKVNSYSKLLHALGMDEEQFHKMFPELAGINEETDFDAVDILSLVDIFKTSKKYEKYLLEVAAEERKTVCAYLAQEMRKDKQFSIVEYWGRGYTQENFTRLWHEIMGEKVPVTFYYSRSTLPSDEYNIRKNFTSQPQAQQYIESIFANMPYKSIEKYNFQDGKWVPEIVPLSCDRELFYAMETYLPAFARAYCALPVLNRDRLGRDLIDYAINFYHTSQEWDMFAEFLAPLVDSVELYGEKKEYAKEFTLEDLEDIKNGKRRKQITKSVIMSYNRAADEVKDNFKELFELREGEKVTGGWKISDEAIAQNREFRERHSKYNRQQLEYKRAYDMAVLEKSIKNKILIISNTSNLNQLAYRSLLKALENQSDFLVKTITMKGSKMSAKKFAAHLATSKYIIIDKPIPKLSGITFREGTELILICDRIFNYYYNGLCKRIKPREKKELEYAKMMSNISAVQVVSDELIPYYEKDYNVNVLTHYEIKGSCVSDNYFDNTYIQDAEKHFYEVVPEARGKKIIAYMPYHRFRSKKAQYAEMLDMDMLQKKLGDEYFVVVHMQNITEEQVSNKVSIPGFSKEVSELLKAREVIIAADIIVGDYRDTIFEASLLNKPVFLSAWDWEDFTYGKNVIYPYENVMCGVLLKNTEDLVDKIRNLDSYDWTNVKHFKEKYLTYCDGHSAKRLVQYMVDRVNDSEESNEF